MLGVMASGGMTPGRGGLTLAERAALAGVGAAGRDEASGAAAGPGAEQDGAASQPRRSEPVGGRHCWVTGLTGTAGRWPGLLAEWSRRDGDGQEGHTRGGWFGRVVYAVDDGGRVVLVEAWVPAEHLQPAG